MNNDSTLLLASPSRLNELRRASNENCPAFWNRTLQSATIYCVQCLKATPHIEYFRETTRFMLFIFLEVSCFLCHSQSVWGWASNSITHSHTHSCVTDWWALNSETQGKASNFHSLSTLLFLVLLLYRAHNLLFIIILWLFQSHSINLTPKVHAEFLSLKARSPPSGLNWLTHSASTL